MLSLERLGKASLIEDYWEVFLLFGAAIQMIDDWNDLEDDLANGHYSYVTLGLNTSIFTMIPEKHPEFFGKIKSTFETPKPAAKK
jgi:hypothetical protein